MLLRLDCVVGLYSHVVLLEEQMSKFHGILMESMLSSVVRVSSGRRIISFFEKVLFFL